MHERCVTAGVAVAGIDSGESYGSPEGVKAAEGQGHSFWQGFFRSQLLVDFLIKRARGIDDDNASAAPPAGTKEGN